MSRGRSGGVPLLVTSIGAAMLLVFLMVLYVVPPPSGPSSSSPLAGQPVTPHRFTAAPNTTIVPQGTSWLVPSGSFQDVLFQLTLPGEVGGGFYASPAVTVYVLSTAAFIEFETNHTTEQYVWMSPNVYAGSLTLSMTAGTWYLVFVNASPDSAATIQVTSPILATFPLDASSWSS